MIKKIHITKQENSVPERALQLRHQDPDDPIESQLWVNLENNSINIVKNGDVVQLNKLGYAETVILTEENINSKSLTVSNPILNPASIKIYPSGGPIQLYSIDFVLLEMNIISWDGLGLDGLLDSGDSILIEYS